MDISSLCGEWRGPPTSYPLHRVRLTLDHVCLFDVKEGLIHHMHAPIIPIGRAIESYTLLSRRSCPARCARSILDIDGYCASTLGSWPHSSAIPGSVK